MKHFTRQITNGTWCSLYRTSDFEGRPSLTEEGEVRWVAREDVPNMDLAYDMLQSSCECLKRINFPNLFYRERLENDFLYENFKK